MNWLDITLLAIVLLTAVMGVVRGLVRQVIGLIAVVFGLILAGLYYRAAGDMFDTFIKNALFSRFLGFLFIFILVLIAGALLGHLLTKAMVGPLALVNRLFGGVFGLVKGVLVCGVIAFALVTFKVAEPAMKTSTVAPFCLGIARAAVNVIPQDLRNEFNDSYKAIRDSGGRHGQKI